MSTSYLHILRFTFTSDEMTSYLMYSKGEVVEASDECVFSNKKAINLLARPDSKKSSQFVGIRLTSSSVIK